MFGLVNVKIFLEYILWGYWGGGCVYVYVAKQSSPVM